MITFTTADLNAWLTAFIWPLTRILGLMTLAPLYGNASVPATVKVAFGVLLATIVAPVLPALPALPPIDPMSLAGLLILIQQYIIGLALGFAMRIAFAGVEMAGELSGLTMGFGFATFFDPQSQGRSSAISQFLALLVLMLYLTANVHLLMLSTLIDTFSSLPITASPINGGGIYRLVLWGGHIFTSGVQLSLPIIAALLISNLALGILTRAAPQLNLFGIGFPITLGMGFILLGLVLPYLTQPMLHLLMDAMDAIKRIAAGMV